MPATGSEVPRRPVADREARGDGDQQRGDDDARAAVAQEDRQRLGDGARAVGGGERERRHGLGGGEPAVVVVMRGPPQRRSRWCEDAA